jgi:hypothetical protein
MAVCRTIANLDGSEQIQAKYTAEAVERRLLDRQYWKRGQPLTVKSAKLHLEKNPWLNSAPRS